MAEFFHMGGHAFYIWTSYAIVLVSLVYAFVAPIGRHKRLLHELERTIEKTAPSSRAGR